MKTMIVLLAVVAAGFSGPASAQSSECKHYNGYMQATVLGARNLGLPILRLEYVYKSHQNPRMRGFLKYATELIYAKTPKDGQKYFDSGQFVAECRKYTGLN